MTFLNSHMLHLKKSVLCFYSGEGWWDEEEKTKTVSPQRIPSVWDFKLCVQGVDGMTRHVREKIPEFFSSSTYLYEQATKI